jgi:hypothetical protein
MYYCSYDYSIFTSIFFTLVKFDLVQYEHKHFKIFDFGTPHFEFIFYIEFPTTYM